MKSRPLDPDSAPRWLKTLWPTNDLPEYVLAGVDDDDCAVIQNSSGLTVITTDYVNSRPILFELGIGSEWDLGRIVVASNLADLCGSGAAPTALLLAVMLKRGSSLGRFQSLAEGVAFEAKKWGVPVVGGDTKLGDSDSVLAVAVGWAGCEAELFLKSRGRPGDIVWVSGCTGGCAAAVLGLSRKVMPDEWNDWAKAAITQPELPLERSRALARERLSCSGTDISDGLGEDLKRLCTASGVGATIDAASIPVAEHAARLANAMELEPWCLAFGTGGDFQFIVSTPPEAEPLVSSLGFHPIGVMTENPEITLRMPGGDVRPFPVTGHRDARGLSFADEIFQLATEAHRGS